MAKKTILFHADDYGANREVSAHILDCYREGALNSLSVLPNGDCLDECMRMLEPYREQVNISIHFNLRKGIVWPIRRRFPGWWMREGCFIFLF